MPWYGKEQAIPLDQVELPGFSYIDGDELAEKNGYIFTRGHKFPIVTFESGLKCPVHQESLSTPPMVYIFGGKDREMMLPFFSSRDIGYLYAGIIADNCVTYRVFKKGVDRLVLKGDKLYDDYEVEYDNTQKRIVNITPQVATPEQLFSIYFMGL